MGDMVGVDLTTESRYGVPHMPPKGHFAPHCPTTATVTIDAGPERGMAMEGKQAVGNGLYLPGQVAGNVVNFLVDTGFWKRS